MLISFVLFSVLVLIQFFFFFFPRTWFAYPPPFIANGTFAPRCFFFYLFQFNPLLQEKGDWEKSAGCLDIASLKMRYAETFRNLLMSMRGKIYEGTAFVHFKRIGIFFFFLLLKLFFCI